VLQDEENPGTCACAARHSDLMRAPPAKKDWLRKTTCPRCGKVYWTNKETDYCMDCEPVALAPSSRNGST
jgi:hypothetical protein